MRLKNPFPREAASAASRRLRQAPTGALVRGLGLAARAAARASERGRGEAAEPARVRALEHKHGVAARACGRCQGAGSGIG